MSGFAAVALSHPKYDSNIGGVMRAAQVYDVSLIVIEGDRSRTSDRFDTMKAYRSIPVIRPNDMFDGLPYDCVPVAVDLVPDAVSLVTFKHPKRAFYVFGPEDGTLGKRHLDKCKYRVMVPTKFCMNLAATVNVVLYDRMAKDNLK